MLMKIYVGRKITFIIESEIVIGKYKNVNAYTGLTAQFRQRVLVAKYLKSCNFCIEKLQL